MFDHTPLPPTLRRLAAALFVLAAVFAFWAALQPGLEPPGHGVDKLVHSAVFALLAGLGLAAAPDRRWLLVNLIGLAALGAFIEVAQYLVGRDASVLDLLGDLIGIALGAMAARHLIGLGRGFLFAR